MKKWLSQPKGEQVLVTIPMSPYNAASFNDYKKENPTTQFEVNPKKKPVSENLRGYYFSAVIPEVRATCDEWKDLGSTEMHEIIKKMFFYFEAYNPITKRTERYGRSVMSDSEWNNTEKATNFLMILGEYLATCGREMPDPQEFKARQDIPIFID